MRTPSPPYGRLDLAPPSADQFIFGVVPLDYGPVLLRRPFGFRLTADTLPSGNCERWLQVGLGCLRLSSSCPVRPLHTFSRPARSYPRLWIRRSSFEHRRDLNPPESRAAQRTIGLVDPIAFVRGLRMRPASLIQFWRIGLDPAPDATGVNLHAPFRQNLGDMFVGQRISQVPAHAQNNHLARIVASFERVGRGDRHESYLSRTAVPKFAIEPPALRRHLNLNPSYQQ